MSDKLVDQENRATKISVVKTPYDVMQDAIAAGIQPTIQECWPNFAYWETARNFADDPSHPAKAAIEWVYAMEDLRAALDEFEGDAKQECIAALNQAYQAFSKIEHSDELVCALERWIEYRKSE